MVHQYLKTCVLSVCVAALCGGRAFGAWFACEKCKRAIAEENWGKHRSEVHKDNVLPEKFVCLGCCRDKDNKPENKVYLSNRCGNEGKETFDEHVRRAHKVRWRYVFLCSACNKEEVDKEKIDKEKIKRIDVNGWIMHLYRECECYKGIYAFASSGGDSKEFGGSGLKKGTFLCLLCQKKGEVAVFPDILKYEHLRDKHLECLPKRKFYCKSCNEAFSEVDWEKHMEEKHKECETFRCPACRKTVTERYEEHRKVCHPGRCPFCKKQVSEEERGKHMREEHEFLCPICGKQADPTPELHVNRAHPCFEGFCKCKKWGGNDVEPCIWPSYRVSGCSYIRHLLDDTHYEVSEDGMKASSFHFVWCPFWDFLGPREKVLLHTYSKHEGCFYECSKCYKLDFEKNGEQHWQVEHDKSHWWCKECAGVISYNFENEGKPLESRNRHLLEQHGEIYMVCPVCPDVVRREDLGDHASEKHPKEYCFYCQQCSECVEGNKVDHIENKHANEWFWCGICGRWEHALPSKHHEEEHWNCFFCKVCLGSFLDRVWHIKQSHPDAKECDVCEELFLPYELNEGWHLDTHKNLYRCPVCKKDFLNRVKHIKGKHPGGGVSCACGELLLACEFSESWHVSKHSVHCRLCNKTCSLDHMSSVHKCTDKCKLIPNERKKIWEWQCDPSCKNLIKPCPLKSSDCQFTGMAEQLTAHMRGIHGCTQDCRFNESGDFIHSASCGNEPAVCSICNREVPDRKQHWVKEHKCVKGCPVASGSRTSGHNFCCEQWVGTCLMCGTSNTDHEHRKKEHGCTEECVLSQVTDKDGTYISVEHHGHKDGKVGKIGMWVKRSK